VVCVVAEVPNPGQAAGLAGELLASLGDRWLHTQGVASRAEEYAASVPTDDRELLVVAAWWHDLGYAPKLAHTGFHGATDVPVGGFHDRPGSGGQQPEQRPSEMITLLAAQGRGWTPKPWCCSAIAQDH